MSGMDLLGIPLGGGKISEKKEHNHVPDGACCAGDNANSSKDHPIFAAVKSGLLVPVQTIAEDGPEVFNMRDEKGHTPAHWACLGGHMTILRFIMDNKGPVDQPSNNELGALPIHWACVNGHINIVDVLLQYGVNIDTTDLKGCTPLIVACQYGHTMLAGYLMGKGARLQMVDKDGDNALHWASFKGHSELMRLLIYSGFNPRQKDNYGQTPLHLACINGTLVAVSELCEQDGVEADLADKNGKTPLMLAHGRKHEEVCDYLQRQIKKKKSILPKIDFYTIAFGPPGNSKGAILFFMVNVICWGYPMYIVKCLPYTWNELQLLHIVFFFVNIAMWICLFHASTTDPGFLPRNIPEYDLAIKQVAHFDEWKHGENPLSRLCHTCRTVKPLRSKHCRVCNRCVKVFDHHCPYIYNCVGYYNRPWFFTFVLTMFGNVLFTDIFCYHLLSEFGWDWIVVIGAVEAAVATVAVTAVCVLMLYALFVNLTTNEQLKYKRYAHMKDKDGKLFNPFDGGPKRNFLDFFFIKLLPRDEDGDYTLHAANNITANERVNYKRYKYLMDGKGAFYNPFNRGVLKNMQEFFLLVKPKTESDVEILNV